MGAEWILNVVIDQLSSCFSFDQEIIKVIIAITINIDLVILTCCNPSWWERERAGGFDKQLEPGFCSATAITTISYLQLSPPTVSTPTAIN